MRGQPASSPSRHDRTLVGTIWPLLVIMTLMLTLSLLSVLVISGLRAYIYGQARWAIGELQAVEQLRRYAADGNEATYQKYLSILAEPIGDRVARLQLQSPHPDYALARRGLLAGGNAAADISDMIVLFRLFDRHPLMAHAVQVWSTADALIAGVERDGELLHAQIASRHPDPQQVRALLADVEALHQRVVPMSEDFGATLGTASRQIGALVLLVLPLSCALLLLAGVSLSRSQFRRDERMAGALRDLAESLRHQATHDSLTGLTKSRRFRSAAGRCYHAACARADALLAAVLRSGSIQSDQRHLRHAAGDELIKKVSWLVRAHLHPDDVLARLGGDEFGVLLPGRTQDAALLLAEDIRLQISGQRFHFTQRMFAVSASIGMLALDDSVPSVSEALSAADQACYLAKDNGRNRVQVYHCDDQQVLVRHGEMRWIEKLHAALEEERFAVVAQEIRPIGLRTGHDGAVPRQHFEILLRMVDANGELIAPMAFIPAAERYGLMPRVDRWVIARVCRELARLRDGGEPLPTCMVNLSGTSVCDSTLAEYIAECLRENDLATMLLGFELTETAAVANLGQAAQLMTRAPCHGLPDRAR